MARYAPSLPRLTEADAGLVSSLRTDGVAYTTLDHLDSVSGVDVKRDLTQHAATLAGRNTGTASITSIDRGDLLEDVRVWRWGLSERLLDIAENYIGLPVTYYGGFVARQVADGYPGGDRQWHRDIEDHHMMKILIWLEDVSPQGGAFEYVSRERTLAATARLRYVGGFLTDGAVRHVLDVKDWRKAAGPRWTAVMADTAQIFHRAGLPEDRDRYSVTFTWTSRNPLKTIPSQLFTSDQVRRIRAGLSSRQLAALPAALRLGR